MERFNINTNFNGCTFHATDNTMYTPELCTVEFVAYVKDGISTISAKSKRIEHGFCKHVYHYEPEVDGKYVYYNIVLPCYQLFDCKNKVNIPLGYFVGETVNGEQIICLNQENSVSLSTNGASVEIKVIDDWKDLINTTKLVGNIQYSSEFFSICNLNKCVAKLQKNYISKYATTCGVNKCKKGSDTDKANRDFLFITSYVLDYLIANKEFAEAEELLDKIKSCGSSLCDEHNSNNCNCNG